MKYRGFEIINHDSGNTYVCLFGKVIYTVESVRGAKIKIDDVLAPRF